MLDLSPRRSALSLAIGCGLAISAAGPSQAAGLLDFLFGSSAPQAQPQAAPAYNTAAPLRMRVQPRSFERRHAGAKVVGPKQKLETKPKLATPIDPKANPGWYLDDSTLRKGDIVVLKGKVLVYEGRRGPSTPSDFASLQDSKLVSTGERARIKDMAGLPAASPAATAPVAAVEPARTAPEMRVTQATLQAPVGR